MNRTSFGAAAAALVSMVVVFVLKTYADTLILDAYGVAYVPHFFVAEAAMTILMSAGYGQLMRRGRTRTVDAALLSLGAVAALVAPALAARGSFWPFAVALVVSAMAALGAMITWNAATGVVTGRAARAFIPRVGAAATAGAVVGGVIASAVVAIAGTRALGPVAGVLTVGMTAIVWWLDGRRPSETSSSTGRRRRRTSGDRSARALIIALATAAVLEALLAAVIDLGFKGQVASHYNGESLGMFFALFYAATNTVLLLMQLVVAPRLLSAMSLRHSLAIEPLGIAGLALAWAIAPGLVLGGLIRGTEIAGKFGIARPAQEIALSPLGDHTRRRWKVLLRGVFSQGGAVAGGSLLVVLGPWLDDSAVVLPALTLTLAAAWFVTQLAVGRRYLDTLGSALGMLKLSRRDRAGLELDRDGIGKVVELVASERPEIAALGREILTQATRDSSALAPHLEHRDPQVRAAVYRHLARAPDGRIARRLGRAAVAESGEHGATLAAAFDALAAQVDPCAKTRAHQLLADTPLERALEDGAEAVIAAWSYLVAIGALDHDADALARGLRALLTVDGPRAAALYRGAVERQCLDGDTADLAVTDAMAASTPDARANGRRAAAALGRSRPLVQLLKALESNATGAEASIAELDGAGLGRLAMLAGARQASPALSARLVRGLRANQLEAAAVLAARYLCHPDALVRDVATRTLARHINDYGNHVDEQLIEDALTDRLDSFEVYVGARWAEKKRTSSMVFRHDMSASADVFLIDELERQTERALSRLCAVLALLGNPAKVHAAERALLAPTLRNRRGGVDILQEVAPGASRLRLFPLLERFLSPPEARDAAALEAVCDADPWLARCAGAELRRMQYTLWALRTNQLFDRIDGDSLVALAEAVVEERYTTGDIVAREGQVAGALWVVLEGTLALTREGREVGRLGGGQAFGQLSLVDGSAPVVTATARGSVLLLRLPRDAFERARQQHHELGLGLVRGLAASLRRANAAASSGAGR